MSSTSSWPLISLLTRSCHLSYLRLFQVKYIQPLPTNPDGSVAVELPQAAAAAELRELSDSLADTQVGQRMQPVAPVRSIRMRQRPRAHIVEASTSRRRLLYTSCHVICSPRARWWASAARWTRLKRWSPSWTRHRVRKVVLLGLAASVCASQVKAVVLFSTQL